MIAYVTKEVGRVKGLFRERESSLVADKDAALAAKSRAEAAASEVDDRVAAAAAKATAQAETQLAAFESDLQVGYARSQLQEYFHTRCVASTVLRLKLLELVTALLPPLSCRPPSSGCVYTHDTCRPSSGPQSIADGLIWD